MVPPTMHQPLRLIQWIATKTWLDCRDSISIKGFDIFRKDRIGRRGGRVLIFIQSSLKYSVIDDVPDCQNVLESCGIEIFSDWATAAWIVQFLPTNSMKANSHSYLNRSRTSLDNLPHLRQALPSLLQEEHRIT